MQRERAYMARGAAELLRYAAALIRQRRVRATAVVVIIDCLAIEIATLIAIKMAVDAAL